MTQQGFTLTSPALVPDAIMPALFSCDGQDISPELRWMHPPAGTRSFALIVEDPDAPRGTFTHWVLVDIPEGQRHLEMGESNVGIPCRNDFQHEAYGGPCPPPNHGDHRYFFRLYALDIPKLNLPRGATRAEAEAAMKGHILGQTQLMGRYARTTG